MPAMITAPDSSTPMVELKLISSKGNLRREVGDVSELAASIAAVGLIEPLVVTHNGGKGYDLLAGHRRLEALKALKWKTAPVHIIDTSASDADVARLAIQLVENLQRHDLDPIEEAQGYAQLKAFGWKQSEVAKRVGRSEAHVSKRLSLLELPDRAIDLAQAGRLGSESLYELTKVVKAGGDLEPILDHLSDPDGFDEDSPPHIVAEEIEHLVDGAVRDAAAGAEIADRLAELTDQGIKAVQPAYQVDTWGNSSPKLPSKGKLGYGFDLDVDQHSKEPCHIVYVYPRWGSAYEDAYCDQPARHHSDGESKLKLKVERGAAKRAADEKERKARVRRRNKAIDEAARAVLSGRAPAKDKVLEKVAEAFLDQAWAEIHNKALDFLDIERSGYKNLIELYEKADGPNRTRILLAAVLAAGHVVSTPGHITEDSPKLVAHLQFLAELGQPIDPKKIENGAWLDQWMEDNVEGGADK